MKTPSLPVAPAPVIVFNCLPGIYPSKAEIGHLQARYYRVCRLTTQRLADGRFAVLAVKRPRKLDCPPLPEVVLPCPKFDVPTKPETPAAEPPAAAKPKRARGKKTAAAT